MMDMWGSLSLQSLGEVRFPDGMTYWQVRWSNILIIYIYICQIQHSSSRLLSRSWKVTYSSRKLVFIRLNSYDIHYKVFSTCTTRNEIFKLLHNFACLVNWLIVKEYFHKYLLNDRYLDTYKMHMNGSKQDLTNFSKRYWNQGKIAIPVHVTGTTA